MMIRSVLYHSIYSYKGSFLCGINGPIFLQTIPITVQAQRILILFFCFFFKDDKAHNVHDKDVYYLNSITNLIHYLRLLDMIPKNKDPLHDHPIKNYPDSGSNILSLNQDRDRLQKYWANQFILKTAIVHSRHYNKQ